MDAKDSRNPIRKILSQIVQLLNNLPGADRLTVCRYQITNDKIPAAFDGYRIVQLSDLHGRQFGQEQRQLIEKVRELQPDLILITGDWLDVDYTKEDRDCIQAVVKGLLPAAPVYGILGNHEARARRRSRMIKELHELGLRLLLNQNVTITRGKDAIRLIGLKTSYNSPLRAEPKEYGQLRLGYERAFQGSDSGLYQIVMGHRPELLPLYEELGADLVLSGHAHGGLMKLPGGRRLLAPGQGLFPQYTHGRYCQGRTQMIVSCGLGGPRIGIRPEITYITLNATKSDESEDAV